MRCNRGFWGVAAVAALVGLAVLVAAALRVERFVLQSPLRDTRLARRAYTAGVVDSTCSCAARCKDDAMCGAFEYDAGDAAMDVCRLHDVRTANAAARTGAEGTVLTYVSSRCTAPDTA